jgi:hypothetical protein
MSGQASAIDAPLEMGNQATVFVLACDTLTSHGWSDEGLGGVTGFKCRKKDAGISTGEIKTR